jgi:hypothetical protein
MHARLGRVVVKNGRCIDKGNAKNASDRSNEAHAKEEGKSRISLETNVYSKRE